jgi:hypothetical protein
VVLASPVVEHLSPQEREVGAHYSLKQSRKRRKGKCFSKKREKEVV